jgi:aspartyl-tRNA(Asn)/glutamyl-tRNA(Gln) amidotransferase subunit A
VKSIERRATELTEAVKTGRISAMELIEAYLARIDERDAVIKGFLSRYPRDDVWQQAAAIDQKRFAGQPLGPLAGLPVAIKDNICTAGHPTSCGSRILKEYCPPYDATVISRIKAADGIIVGKTNMDEFAMGSSTELSAYQVTHNPWNPDYVPGGSSGGSAAVVAAGEVPLALGSDTGGSVRQPASFCGIVGFKPTYGLVSRYGLIAYASSHDQIGVLARNVADCALLADVISGHDPYDSTSLTSTPGSLLPDPGQLCPGQCRIGVPREYFGEGLHPEVRRCLEAAIDHLKQSGFVVVEISLPHTDYAIPAYYIKSCAEAASNLARYDGIKFGIRAPDTEAYMEMYRQTRNIGFGAEVQRRIMLGTFVLSSGYYDQYYEKARRVANLIRSDFMTAFQSCDFLMTPTSPFPAFKIGEKLADPLQLYLADIYTITANLAGLPAISVPCGLSGMGLPVGLQIIGNVLSDRNLLQLAAWYEHERNMDDTPPFFAKS